MKRFYSLIATAILALVSMTASAQVKSIEKSVVGAKQVEGTLTRIGDAQKTTSVDFTNAKMHRSDMATGLQVKNSPAKAPAKAHESDTWKALGTGQYTDDVSSIYGINPTTVEVEVEESNETPGLYRLVDPYKPIQAINGGSYDDSSVRYMYIDATDPAAVQVEDFPTGITYNSGDGEMILVNGVPYGLAAGTMADGVITFAEKTLLCTFTFDTVLYYANTNGKFKVVLPGTEVKDYSIEVVAPTCADGNAIKFTVTVGADVAAIKYGLFTGSYGFNEGNYQYVATNGSSLPQAGTYSFNLAGKDAGRRTLFVAALDAEGNYVGGEGTYFYVVNDDTENWTSLGMGMYGEDFIGSIYQADPSEYEVEVQVNNETPGFYRLVNPYGENFPYAQYNEHATDHNHYIYIHAENPAEVWIEDSPIGQDWGTGGMSVNCLANNFGDSYKTADYYGTLVNGKITFPTKALVMARQLKGHGGWNYANANDMFYVMLPGADEIIEPQDDQINFKERTDLPVSTNDGATDGDITEDKEFVSDKGLFTMTVSPSTGKTPNRVWTGPQLRVYDGTITVDALEGYTIKNVNIAGASGNWNKDANYTINGLKASEVAAIEGNSTAAGKLVYNCDTKQILINVTAQVRIDAITLTLLEDEPLYKEDGVVGAGTLDKGMPFFNTPVKVAVYDNKVVVKNWDGTKGSNLNVYYAKVAQNDEVSTVITGIEQVVNGEVVSEVNDESDDTYVVLYPQSEVYPMAAIYVANEMTGIKLGEDEEAGMGQISLFGMWQPAANVGGGDDNMGVAEPVEAAYIVTWPGEPMEIRYTLAELADTPASEEPMEVVVQLDNAKVTAAFDMDDYFVAFVEDDEAAVQVWAAEIEAGKALTGIVKGVWADYGNGSPVLMINENNATAEDADVTTGTEIVEPNELLEAANVNRLVTVTASKMCPITNDEGMVTIGFDEDITPVYDLFYALGDEYEFPEYIGSVTGVLVPSMMGVVLVPRSAADVVEGEPTPEYVAIGEVKNDADWDEYYTPLLAPQRDVDVEAYKNFVIVRAWAGTPGYDLKVAFDEEENVTEITSIINGVEVYTSTEKHAYVYMNEEDYFIAYIDEGYGYAGSDAETMEGYVILAGYNKNSEWGYYYNIEWPQGSENGVESINANVANGAVYNISGQRVNKNYKGVVIKNGKKALVK